MNPNFQPVEGVQVELFRKGWVKVIDFLDTPELAAARKEPLNLAIISLEGNYLNPNSNIIELKQQLSLKMKAFIESGINTFYDSKTP